MLIKILILFFVVFQATAFKASLTRGQSYVEKLILEKKWDEYRIFRSRAQRSKVINQTIIYDYSDQFYYVNITIGTPRIQQFRVLLDTASANLWVVDKSCVNDDKCPSHCSNKLLCKVTCDAYCCKNDSNGPCDGKQHFDQSLSSTYISNGRSLSIPYGSDSISGFLGNDIVSLGNKGSKQLNIIHTTFGQIDHLPISFKDMNVDGVLGLAFKSIAVDDVQPVFQHAVELGLLDKPIFTVWISKSQNGGQITYGDFDDEHCSSDITYITLSSKTYWEFNIEGTGVNGNKDSKRYSAISDTGSSLIMGPKEPLEKLVKATGAKFNSHYGLFEVKCDVQFTWSIYVNRQEFPIDAKNMIFEIENNKCVIAYESLNAEFGKPKYILGDPFIKQYCQIYEVKDGRIGFAKVIM